MGCAYAVKCTVRITGARWNDSSDNISWDKLSTELRLDGVSPGRCWIPDEAKSDEGGFKERSLLLSEAFHDVGPMERVKTDHSRRSPTTSITVGR